MPKTLRIETPSSLSVLSFEDAMDECRENRDFNGAIKLLGEQLLAVEDGIYGGALEIFNEIWND